MSRWLVTFAVEEEARPFRKLVGHPEGLTICLTGIGPRRAAQAVLAALAASRPAQVLSCGFAGGLDPRHAVGTVLFCPVTALELAPALQRAGAVEGRFHSSPTIVSTVAAKRSLRQSTQADAVEMESGVICALCQERQIPCAILRVISDAADEELPLDFNAFLDAEAKLDHAKLIGALAAAPSRLPRLLRFHRQTRRAARCLARVLVRVTAA